MKQSSIITFTRKCLKAGYKAQVCKDAWVFGKTPTAELKKLYKQSFKNEKVFFYPHARRHTTLKNKKSSRKITKTMMLSALGPRFAKLV